MVTAIMETRNRKVHSVYGVIDIVAVACLFVSTVDCPLRRPPPSSCYVIVCGLWAGVVRSCQVMDEAQRSGFVTWNLIIVL